jgi:excisionase family DNA binding protein
MTVAEAAELLGCKPSTVYELVSLRKLPHYRIGPCRGKIVLDRADVEAYRASCRVEAAREKSTRQTPTTRRGLGLTVEEFCRGDKPGSEADKGTRRT